MPRFIDTAVFLDQFSLTSGADLRVTIDPVPASVSVGGAARYDVTVSNIGPVPAAGVVVTNQFPVGVTHAYPGDVTPSRGTVNDLGGGLYEWIIGALTNGTSATLALAGVFPAAGAFTNLAAVATSTGDYNPTNNAGEGVIWVGADLADLALVKRGPMTACAGTTITYLLCVTNIGPGAAAGIALADLLPNGIQPLGPTNWSLAGLAEGGTACWSLSAAIAPDTPAGWVTNWAAVAAASSDPDPGNNADDAVTRLYVMSDVSVVKHGPSSGVAGEPLTYTLTVTNAGPSLARNVTLDDTPPTGTTAQSPLSYSLGDLPVGASTSLSFTVDVHGDTLGWITNRAEVACGSDSNLLDNVSEVATLIQAFADLSVNKTGPAAGVAGEPLTYTLTVTNAGPSLARGIALADTPPVGTTAQSPLLYNLDDLAAGASTSLYFTVDVNSGTLGWITNRAEVACGSDTNVDDNVSEAVTLINSIADVAVTKTGPATGVAGEPLTYALTVTNAGPSIARGVALADTPPAGTTPRSPLSYTLGDLAAGASTSLLFTVDVDVGTLGWITNRAAVTAVSPDTNSVNNADEAATLIQAFADLSVTKTGPATGVAGEPLTYTLLVANTGPSLARGVALADTPPTGTTPRSPLSYTLGDLAAGASTSLLFTVDVDAGTLGWITNRAAVTAVSPDTNGVNNADEAATQIGGLADLAVTKTGPATGVAGEQLTYALTVTNAGPSIARGVALADTPPAGTTPQSPLSYTLGDLAAGASTSLLFTVDVDVGTLGWITNRAAVTAVSPDTNSVNNADEAATLISGLADLAVIKTGPATGVAGGPLTYTLTVTNAGPSTARGIVIADLPPPATTALSATNLLLASLAPGVATNLPFAVAVDPGALGWITNRAEIASATPDTNSLNNADEAVTLIRAEADLRVTKTAGVSTVPGGTPVVFTLALTNAGPSLAHNVRLEDRQTGNSGRLLWSAVPTNGFELSWSVLNPGDSLRFMVTAETYQVSGWLTNRVTLVSDTPDTNSVDNAARAVVRVVTGTESMAISAVWTLDLSSGLFDVSLTLRNTGTLPLANRYFWMALPVTTEWRLWNPTGTLPDAKTFFDLTYRVRTALQATGNRDVVFDPGESVMVQGPRIYHRRRVNPRNYVNVATAVHFGLLYTGLDRNRNFRIEADELGRVSASWRAGGTTDDTLLEATRLHRGAAYIWDQGLGTWRVLAEDARD